MNDRLTIRLSGRDGELSVDTFLQTSQRVLDALKEIGKGRPKGSGVWTLVGAQMNSPVSLALDGPVEDGRALVRGMCVLEAEATWPEGFSRELMDRARRLTGFSQDLDTVTIGVESDTASLCEITRQCAVNIDVLLGAELPQVRAITSLEGRLDTINLHSERQKFQIFDVLTDRATNCEFSESMKADVKDMLERRVLVTGEVYYGEDGHPTKVEVTRIDPVDDTPFTEEERDSIRLLRPGEDSAEVVWRLRHGE